MTAGGIYCITRSPATRPIPQGPTTQPDRATRPTEQYPPEELAAACREAAEGLRGRLDRRFAITVAPPFVVAGNMPPSQLKRRAEGSVVRPARAMWASYFQKRPDKAITVLLFTGGESYKDWAGRLFNDRRVPHFGYYKPAERTLVMNISTGGGTLVHELTHALIVYDFPDVPLWFNEGLASLHEQCNVSERRLTGLVNWRLPGLQKAISAGKLRPLRELLTKRDFYGRLRGLNYAQARYFCMYMQHKGLLAKFYKHFRENHTGKDADVKAVEHVFEQKLDYIDAAFIEWVKTLKFE